MNSFPPRDQPSFSLLSGVTLIGTACLLSSCQLPTHADGTIAINEPSSVLATRYEPKANFEEDLDDEIVSGSKDFVERSSAAASGESRSILADSFSKSSVDRESWWGNAPSQMLLENRGAAARISLDEIYARTLANSSQVKVFAAIPLIRETAIDEARGIFDPELFTESRYDRTDEPTGSVLETGDPDDFFREEAWTFEGGIKKKFLPGTQVALTQQLSEVSNNSEFFVPGEQGRASLKLSVLQPLLRGAGVKYNRTLIQIAKLDAETGYDEFIRQLETHLMEVNRSYWALYLARTSYLEKSRLVDETEAVVEELENRGNLDTLANQRSRARAALATRTADLVRSELAIRNAESRLRALVNDPYFIENKIGEIIPADLPVSSPSHPEFEASIADAIQWRPEIRQAENHLRAANLREGMAKNEKRPALNLVGEYGVGALRGGGDFEGAYGDQYDDGAPSWAAGVVASVPWGRRSAKARHLRTELEVRQKKDQLRSTMDTVLLEVQIAYREVTTAWPDMKAKHVAAKAADEELAVLKGRRGVDAAAADRSTSLYLESVLDAQDRRARARQEFIEAMVVYNAALTNLDRARGTLLQSEDIGVERTADSDDLPIIRLTKAEALESAKRGFIASTK